MRSSKQIGAETFVKNNGERIVEKWNRGWGIDVWRIGLSEHTKEEEEDCRGRLMPLYELYVGASPFSF